MTEHMHIIELRAENVKRLKAVTIAADRNINVIAGRNGAGKTSVLDAIWWALGGAKASAGQPNPIRDGEDDARVELDLGDLTVIRTWKRGGDSKLTVKTALSEVRSPQAVLDKLVGKLTFDPLEFSRLPAKVQRDQLLGMVDLPFSLADLEAERKSIFDDRTACNRDLDAAKHRLAEMGGRPVPPADAPSLDAAVEQLRALQAVKTKNDGLRDRRPSLDRAIGDAIGEADRGAARVAELRTMLAHAEADHAARVDRVAMLQAEAARADEMLAGLVDPDMTEAAAAVRAAEAAGTMRAAAERWEMAEQEVEAYGSQSRIFTEHLAQIDQEKADGLAAARMPVDGLGFDDDGITYQGVPFAQCSAAEQLRVSVGIAMAQNPTLRVLRITDGSLLDDANMALIAEMAAGADYQVWIERVGTHDPIAVVIEDGEVRDGSE